jgi:hypothetical protein
LTFYAAFGALNDQDAVGKARILMALRRRAMFGSAGMGDILWHSHAATAAGLKRTDAPILNEGIRLAPASL